MCVVPHLKSDKWPPENFDDKLVVSDFLNVKFGMVYEFY